MTFPTGDPGTITVYHAHIYYDPETTRDAAARLRERLEARFTDVRVGGWHDGPVGPHLYAMYQVVFAPELFDEMVPWLMLNSEGLAIFVHPSSGNTYNDHVHFGLWLGEKLGVNEPHLARNRDREAAAT
jgi:DOPA 4,5-dioxygenase